MKSLLFLQTISASLLPENLSGNSKLIFYSKNDFGRFGGCVPYTASEATLVDIQALYTDFSQSQKISNDDFSLQISTETSITKVIIDNTLPTERAGYVTCWDQNNNFTSTFTTAPAANETAMTPFSCGSKLL